MYISQGCHFQTNQVHVGGALAERHEITKRRWKFFLCIL